MTIRIALMGGELIPALINNWAPDVWFADVVVNDDHLPSTPLRWEEALLIGFGREFNVMIRVTAIIHRHFYGGGWEDVLDRGRDENGYVVFGDVNCVPPRPCVHLLYHQTETPTVVDGRVVETVRAVTLTSYSRREWIGHQHEMKQNYNDSARSKSGSGKDGDSGSRNSGRSGWCVIGGRCRGGDLIVFGLGGCAAMTTLGCAAACFCTLPISDPCRTGGSRRACAVPRAARKVRFG